MQVTSLLSRTEAAHAHEDSCGCGHEHAPVRWWQTLVGVVFVANAFIVDWFFEKGTTVPSASALVGAVLLGLPIMVTAYRDLRTGVLSLTELVAIAVLGAFATSDNKTPAWVGLFLVLSQVITCPAP